MNQHNITIYTDGACIGNPGPGGWAALLKYKEAEKLISGGSKMTTNNKMELIAAIEGLKVIKTNKHKICVFSDSKYVVEGATDWVHRWVGNGWRVVGGRLISNKELWQELYNYIEIYDITWTWIKGHNGHPENTRVDFEAREQAKRYR